MRPPACIRSAVAVALLCLALSSCTGLPRPSNTSLTWAWSTGTPTRPRVSPTSSPPPSANRSRPSASSPAPRPARSSQGPWRPTYPRLDPAAPATFSRPVITTLLRGLLGLDGLVVTDDVSAAAALTMCRRAIGRSAPWRPAARWCSVSTPASTRTCATPFSRAGADPALATVVDAPCEPRSARRRGPACWADRCHRLNTRCRAGVGRQVPVRPREHDQRDHRHGPAGHDEDVAQVDPAAFGQPGDDRAVADVAPGHQEEGET